jgi:hypothetical protein
MSPADAAKEKEKGKKEERNFVACQMKKHGDKFYPDPTTYTGPCPTADRKCPKSHRGIFTNPERKECCCFKSDKDVKVTFEYADQQ